MRTLTAADLHDAQAGSYYTIRGAGGPLIEWVEGYESLLAEAGIGKPQEWCRTTGGEVNTYASQTKRKAIFPQDLFKEDLVFLLFPLDGLDVSRLAIFRLRLEDVWFDDMVENMRVLR